MKYEKVFEEVKKISHYAIWGKFPNDKRGIPFWTFGLDSPLHFFGEDIQKFYSVIDSVWQDKAMVYLARKDIEHFILEILDAIHTNGEDATRNDNRLKNHWLELQNRKMTTFHVVFPIYGVIVPEITHIGQFTAYNFEDYKKFFTENSFTSENHLQSHFEKQEKSSYLTLEVKAKSPDRAIEWAIKDFELFECIAKFWLMDSPIFDVGIFHYNKWTIKNGYAFNKETLAGSFESKGSFQPVPINFLIKIRNADKFWDMVTRYVKGKTTEIENGVINAVRWVGIANSNDSDVTRYVQYIFALEALLAKPKEEIITPSIAYRLSEGAAFIIGETAKTTEMDKKDFRKKIFYDVKSLYSSRSKIVHGTDRQVNKDDLNKARHLIYNLIISFMYNEEILKFKDTTELAQWIENLKFKT